MSTITADVPVVGAEYIYATTKFRGRKLYKHRMRVDHIDSLFEHLGTLEALDGVMVVRAVRIPRDWWQHQIDMGWFVPS